MRGLGATRLRDVTYIIEGESDNWAVLWHFGHTRVTKGLTWYVLLNAWPAGATTALNCNLCQAGTYGTGSGPCDRNTLSQSEVDSEWTHTISADGWPPFKDSRTLSVCLFHPKPDTLCGVRAPLWFSTADYARQAPTGQDQVRVRRRLMTIELCYEISFKTF